MKGLWIILTYLYCTSNDYGFLKHIFSEAGTLNVAEKLEDKDQLEDLTDMIGPGLGSVSIIKLFTDIL